MIGWRHRFAMWLGPRLLARSVRAGGVDASNVVAKGDALRKAMRG